MPKTEWGTKRVCPVTGKRFFDMNRTPVVSPYTGEVVPLDTGRQNRVLVADKADKKSVVAEEEEEVVLEDDDDEVDVADTEIDDDLLEDDDDDSVSLDEIADVPGDDDDT